MRAMIFAAGLGTRLKPYTLHHPKALVPVGGVPMLQRVILKLKGTGIDEMVVNVHHFAQQIVDFLAENDNFGCKIHISDETGLLLDTGGGLLQGREWLTADNEPIVVHNADILTDFDLNDMVNAHRSTNNMATLLVAQRDTSRYLLMDSDMRMYGWTNIKTGEVKPSGITASGYGHYAFGGVHVVSTEIFNVLSHYSEPGMPFSIMDFYIDTCHHCRISGYEPHSPYIWVDIGKVDTLAAAETIVSKDKNS